MGLEDLKRTGGSGGGRVLLQDSVMDGGNGGRTQRWLQREGLQWRAGGLDGWGRKGKLHFVGQHVLLHELLICLGREVFEFFMVIWREYQRLVRQGEGGY